MELAGFHGHFNGVSIFFVTQTVNDEMKLFAQIMSYWLAKKGRGARK